MKDLKFSLIGFLLLATVPALYFYPFSIPALVLSLILAILLKDLSGKKFSPLKISLFTVILVISLFISSHHVYKDMAIDNVTNSQRGEHPSFQTNIAAKILHNKTTAGMFYLQNLNDRLSISSVFASGSYPNLSKYLPLGFLFPWYLVGFVLAIRRKYPEYLNSVFLAALSVLLTLTAVLTRSSAEIFMFSLIWFTCLESVEQLQKLPKPLIYFIIALNLGYLGIFFMSLKVFLNQ